MSTAFKQILVDNYGVSANRVSVVPGGIDCDRFDIAETQSEARGKLRWPADRPIVLAVRRLTQRMGLENLIEAAASVRQSVPGVLFLIAGGGAQHTSLDELIHRRRLSDTVKLVGFVPDADLPIAYRAANLTIVPTVALEGFGLVAAESLSAGTPVIATPVGGLVDLLRPLSEEFLIPGTGVTDVTNGLTNVLTGRSSLPSSTECAAYARQRFNWHGVSSAIGLIYREAIQDYNTSGGRLGPR